MGAVVRVGAVRVVRHVRQHLAALGPVGVHDLLALLGHERLGLGAGVERRRARHQREGVEARDVRHRRARRLATEVEQQAAVLGHHPAGAVLHPGARLALDVRDPVGVVGDRDVAAPDGLGLRRPDRPEVHRQVEVEDVAQRHVAPQRRQPRVQRQLIERVRPGGHAAVVAGRQDVAGDVTAGGLGGGRSEQGEQERRGGRGRRRGICGFYQVRRAPRSGRPLSLARSPQ